MLKRKHGVEPLGVLFEVSMEIDTTGGILEERSDSIHGISYGLVDVIIDDGLKYGAR